MSWCKKYIATKNWKDSDIVYGIYRNNVLVYIGKTADFEKRKSTYVNGKYKDCEIRLMKIGKAKIHWEKVLIEWNSLKYKLDNNIFNIRTKKVTDKQKEKLCDFYKIKWKNYKHPVVLKYDLILGENKKITESVIKKSEKLISEFKNK